MVTQYLLCVKNQATESVGCQEQELILQVMEKQAETIRLVSRRAADPFDLDTDPGPILAFENFRRGTRVRPLIVLNFFLVIFLFHNYNT